MKVNLDDILEAIDFTDRETEYFLDMETGEVVWINEIFGDPEENQKISDQLDKHGFLRLPTAFEINDYDTMADFIDELPDSSKKERLADAITGRGAFRRFKDLVNRFGLADQWYRYQENAHRRQAIEWCEENDLEYCVNEDNE